MCSKEDIVRMHHILDAAKEAVSFAQGKTRKSLDKNRMLMLSLVKDVVKIIHSLNVGGR